jgi:voltage-gated potassium channel
MTEKVPSPSRHSLGYDLFIFVLTIISLVLMVVMFLPLSGAAIDLLRFYDNLICVIFLTDFFLNLRAAHKKSDYLIRERGWLDLLGSFPSLGLSLRFSGIFRLFRLSRLARISRLLRTKNKKQFLRDVARNRSQYAAVITILTALIVLSSASVLVLAFESQSPDAKITTGVEAIWYAFVTITTVGYGDYYPVTIMGRITALFLMITGVGIIGALASMMASLLLGSPSASAEEATRAEEPGPTVEAEIAAIKNELAAIRQLLDKTTTQEAQENLKK